MIPDFRDEEEMQKFYKEQTEESMDMSDIILKEHKIKLMMGQLEKARQTKLPEYFKIELNLRREWFDRMTKEERERWEVKLKARFAIWLEGYWKNELKNEPTEARLPTEVRQEKMWRRLRMHMNDFYHQTHYQMARGPKKYEKEFMIPEKVNHELRKKFKNAIGIKKVMEDLTAPLQTVLPMQYIPNFLEGKGELEQKYLTENAIKRYHEAIAVMVDEKRSARK